MIKLRTKIMLLVCSVVVAILLLNQYPVSMSMKQTIMDANGSALLDVTYQLSLSSDLVEGLTQSNATGLDVLARQTELCANCSGLAILDNHSRLYYNSSEHTIADSFLAEYGAVPLDTQRYEIRDENTEHAAIYALCPIYGPTGEPLGRIIAKLQYQDTPTGLDKAQRDLNAMTLLVMLIALIFVWDLTDNIKNTMFNLEPVEIAQLLVERTALIDAVRDGILSVDQEGRILHVNRTAQALCRRAIPQFDAEGGGFFQLFPHIQLQSLLEENQPLYDNECLIGTDSFYVNFTPIKIDKPHHESLLITFRLKQEVVRFAEDITGVRSYIEALRGQMHEFNNKLQVVSRPGSGKKYPELTQYVHDLIHLKNREMLQINKKIKDPILSAFLLSKFDRAAEQKVDLVLTDRSTLDSPLPEPLVQDLVVIIGNLLENAFDAVQGCAMKTVTLELVEGAGEICVCVWDSGMSIPEPLRDGLFDYGVTSKREGHGIGLFLVRQSCTRYNGYITLSSDLENGTEFIAHIPFLKEQEGEYVPHTDC